MQTQEAKKADRKFLIRPLRCECSSVKYCELCQAIERIGGVKTDEGYAFPTAYQRTVAGDVLGDRFGTRYFEVL